MYIVFCGMSSSGKKEYQELSIKYLKEKYGILTKDILVVQDPKSTKLGKDIIALDEKEYQINFTESGLLYLAASCNVYNNLISNAIEDNKHIICRGYFTEILGYQGDILGDKGFNWLMLKSFYHQSLATTHSPKTIKYPDIIFFCANTYEKAQTYMEKLPNNSFEGNLTEQQYEKYTAKIVEAFNIISHDQEFTQHTKVILVGDTSSALPYNGWDSVIRHEIDILLSADHRPFSNLFAEYDDGN